MADKKVSKKDLSRLGSTMAGIIYAYAVKTENSTFKEAVNFSASDLLRIKDGELATRCQTIHDKGVEFKDNLADYGVTTATPAALQTAIDGFAQTVTKPRSAITERATVKANIKQLFKDADAILMERMDRLAEDFAEDHPDFVATYKSARIIIDPKTKKKKTGNGEGNGNNPPA